MSAKPRRDAAATAARVLEAAAVIASTSGFTAVKAREVGKAASVTATTVCASGGMEVIKQKLLERVFSSLVDLFPELSLRYNEQRSPADLIVGLFEAEPVLRGLVAQAIGLLTSDPTGPARQLYSGALEAITTWIKSDQLCGLRKAEPQAGQIMSFYFNAALLLTLQPGLPLRALKEALIPPYKGAVW